MESFVMTMGYIFIIILTICVSGSIIYWLLKLWSRCMFALNYHRFTPKYFYTIIRVAQWRNIDTWPGAKTYDEDFYVVRRHRGHIFEKYEYLYRTNTIEEAIEKRDDILKTFPD